MTRGSSFLALHFFVIVAASALAGCSKTADAPQPDTGTVTAPATQSAPAAREVAVKEFMVGELVAMSLRDGGIELPNDNQVFGVGRTPEDVAALIAAAGQPADKLQLDIDPLLIRRLDRVFLFDTGAGSNFGPGAGKLAASLAEAGIDPQSVTDIFISHVHGDHVGGLVNAQGALNFPNATIHMSKPEWEYLAGMNAEAAKSVGLEQHAALVAAIKPKIATFVPGMQIVRGTVKAVEVKGHTPGHSAYLITSGPESLMYVGDSMHHYVVSVQKPDWLCGFDGDGATAAASRAALVAQLAASGQRVYAVHFPFPGIGKIEKRGDGFAWVAE
jgi:glyoxylase-like metal-dependent hydrolase (beta-lactamase superfamily II)